MSETDPYAAPVVEEANPEIVNEVAPEVEAPVVEEANTDVPDGSIKDVLGWVGEDVDRAKAALSYEADNQQRATLVTKLNAIID